MGQNDSMIQAKDIMGLKGIFARYLKNILSDLVFPFVGTLALMFIAWKMDIYSPIVLKEAINVGMDVIPVLLSVLVAGYVLLLTIYFSGNISIFKERKMGRDLLYDISANYAFCILSSILALILTMVVSFFFNLNLESPYHAYINYSCSAGLYLLLFFTLKNLKDLVLALFNFGQSFIFEKQLLERSDNGDKNDDASKKTHR